MNKRYVCQGPGHDPRPNAFASRNGLRLVELGRRRYSDDCHDFKINKKGQLIVEFHCVDSVDPPEEATIKYERTGPDVELSSLHQGKWTATRWSSKVGKGSDPDPFGDEKKFEIGSGSTYQKPNRQTE